MSLRNENIDLKLNRHQRKHTSILSLENEYLYE